MSPPARKDAVQGREDLEALRTALIAMRQRAGISNDAMKIRPTRSGRIMIFSTLDGDDYARLDIESEQEVIDSIREEDRIWHGRDADKLLRWFKEARGGEAPRKKTPAPAGNRSRWEGGWYRVPNVLVDSGLLGMMPLPALRAYLTCYRYAGEGGEFFISHQTLAGKIGCRSRTKGADAMKRLVTAGLVKIERRGTSSRRATDYRLAPLNEKTIERAREFFDCTPRKGRTVPRAGVQTVPPAGDTIQTHTYRERPIRLAHDRSVRAHE